MQYIYLIFELYNYILLFVAYSFHHPNGKEQRQQPSTFWWGALHCRIEAPQPHQQDYFLNFHPIYIGSPVGSALRRRKPHRGSMEPIILCLEAESESEVCAPIHPPSLIIHLQLELPTSTSNLNFQLQLPTSTSNFHLWSIHLMYPNPNPTLTLTPNPNP
jgi:hypothetical protein